MQGPFRTLVQSLAMAGACACNHPRALPAPIAGSAAQGEGLTDAGFDVEILEYPSGKPVPGVEVRASAAFGAWEVENTDACMEQPDAIFRSDEHGIVHVTPVGDLFVLAARHGEHWGLASFDRYNPGVRWLTLVPDRSLRVQVVDTQGNPVPGIPVSLRSIRDGWKHEGMVVRTQGPEGIAVIPHAEYYMWTYAGDPPPSPPTSTFAAALALPLSSPVETVIAGSQVPAELVRLVLPPSGEVEVRCTEADGTPARLELPVVLRLPGVADVDTSGSFPLQRFGTGTWSVVNGWVARAQRGGHVGASTLPLEQGRALFTGIELGQRYDAGVRRNHASADTRASFDGPKRAGERVIVQLRIGAGKAAYSGRLLRPDGTPVANSELTLEEIDHPPAEGWTIGGFDTILEEDSVVVGGPMSLQTDSEGRFQFELEPLSTPSGRIDLALTSERLSSRALGLLVSPADCAPGTHNLGDLIAAPAPVLVGGTIRDDSGRAIGGAELSLTSVKQEFWLWPHGVVERSAPDGTFEIRSFNQYPSRWVKLAVDASGLVAQEIPITPTTRTHVDIVLRRTGQIHGRLLLPDGAARSGYGVTGSYSRGNYGRTRLSASGEFTIDGLPPGRVHVTAYAIHQPGSTTEAGGVDAEVRAGETAEIPPIDLRAKDPPKK